MFDVFGNSNGRISTFLKSFCQILNYNCASRINLESPSLIRRSQKVWDPPKKWSNCANVEVPNIISKDQGMVSPKKPVRKQLKIR